MPALRVKFWNQRRVRPNQRIARELPLFSRARAMIFIDERG
jgi:hypothetical protein